MKAEQTCESCGEAPRQFPEDPEVWLCRCDTTAQEWRSGHLVTDAGLLYRLKMGESDALTELAARANQSQSGDSR
jgi:hypothetical protein